MQRADVSLTNSSKVDVAAGDGGSIAINARNLDISGGSDLIAGIREGSGAVGSKAGDVTLNATDAITLRQSSTIQNRVNSKAIGDSGEINVTAGSISITDGASLSTDTFGQGNAGGVTINARDQVSFDGGQVFTGVNPEAVGKGGDININVMSGSLSVTNGAGLDATIVGHGNGGSINITARDRVSFDGTGSNGISSDAQSIVDFGAVGKGGNININVTGGSFYLTNRAVLGTSTLGQGDAGSVTINARDTVSLDGAGSNRIAVGSIFTNTFNVGRGGDIYVNARSLSLNNGAGLLASTTNGPGDAGNIWVNTADSVTLTGVSASNGISSGLYTNSINAPGTNGKGGYITVNTAAFRVADGAVVNAQNGSPSNGGNVTINAKTFEAANGGQVLTGTTGSGKAGDIALHVTDSVNLSGSDPTYAERVKRFDGTDNEGDPSGQIAPTGLFADTTKASSGNGGNISIDPIKLNITDGAGVAVGSLGRGQAGNLLVQAGTVTLDHSAFLSAEAASVNGGDLTLQVQDLLLMRHGSRISTTAGTANTGGNGGNININTPFLVTFPAENSDISANAFTGNGGNVTISAQGIFGTQFQQVDTPDSDITASSTDGGIKGAVNLNTSGIDPSRRLVALPAVVVDKSGLIAQGCAAGDGTTGSQFIVTGRGGLPPNPGEPFSSDAVWSDARLPAVTIKKHHSQTVSALKPSTSAAVPLVPATGWVFNGKGEVSLIARAPSDTIQFPWITPAFCHAQQR